MDALRADLQSLSSTLESAAAQGREDIHREQVGPGKGEQLQQHIIDCCYEAAGIVLGKHKAGYTCVLTKHWTVAKKEGIGRAL